MRSLRRRRDRGIALLLVLVAVVLVAALATEVAQTARTQQRMGSNTMNDYLLRTAVTGRVHILRGALRFDGTSGERTDTEDDVWSWRNRDTLGSWGERNLDYGGQDEATATYRNTDVKLVAFCEDEHGKLNLLALSKPPANAWHKATKETLIRLIDEFREDWSDVDMSESDGEEMVEDLIEFLSDQSEEEENPIPSVEADRGKLHSLDDLLRVPGGKWTQSILYDVKNPDEDEEDRGNVEEGEDADWRRPNGVPGLINFLSVESEAKTPTDATFLINFNTAPTILIRALLDRRDRDLADAIVEYRRMGAGDEEDAPAEDEEGGWFTARGDLSKVEGMPADDAALQQLHPRIHRFFSVSSTVYSLRVIATMVTGQTADVGGDEDEDDEGPKDIEAAYQYREVLVRTANGFRTLLTERRHDPIFDQ